MEKFYPIEQVIEKAKGNGFIYWADEDSVLRPLDNFIVIFFAKYSHQRDFTFIYREIKGKHFIVARNIGGFEYVFPLDNTYKAGKIS
jgi:hypothetical protein